MSVKRTENYIRAIKKVLDKDFFFSDEELNKIVDNKCKGDRLKSQSLPSLKENLQKRISERKNSEKYLEELNGRLVQTFLEEYQINKIKVIYSRFIKEYNNLTELEAVILEYNNRIKNYNIRRKKKIYEDKYFEEVNALVKLKPGYKKDIIIREVNDRYSFNYGSFRRKYFAYNRQKIKNRLF